jgi:hypothetical protein
MSKHGSYKRLGMVRKPAAQVSSTRTFTRYSLPAHNRLKILHPSVMNTTQVAASVYPRSAIHRPSAFATDEERYLSVYNLCGGNHTFVVGLSSSVPEAAHFRERAWKMKLPGCPISNTFTALGASKNDHVMRIASTDTSQMVSQYCTNYS